MNSKELIAAAKNLAMESDYQMDRVVSEYVLNNVREDDDVPIEPREFLGIDEDGHRRSHKVIETNLGPVYFQATQIFDDGPDKGQVRLTAHIGAGHKTYGHWRIVRTKGDYRRLILALKGGE